MRSTLSLASVGIGASASVIVPPHILPRGESGSAYTFHLEAQGKASGPIGQLFDGQNRIGGNLPLGYYTIKYGSKGGVIFDKNGRGCILTPPTTQFQCDQGVGGTPGFDISCDKQLLYNGSPEFWACPVDDHGVWNLYTKPNFAQKKCITITLSVHGESTPEPTCKQMAPPPPPPCKGDCKPAPPPDHKGKLSPDGTCGGTTGLYCNGFIDGSCCSSYGWCGSTPAHCGEGCQGDFGTCKMHKEDYKPTPPPPPPCDDKDEKCKPAPPALAPCKEDECKPAPPPPAPCKDDKCKPTPSPTCGSDQHDDKCKPTPPPSLPCDEDHCKPTGMMTACPANLNGPYEFPHLIVPVYKQWPDKAYGNKLNGTFSDNICTIFNFDISPRFAGKTCSLAFLFPKQENLVTSAYKFESPGDKAKLQFYALEKPAGSETTWNNMGKKKFLADGGIYPNLAVEAYAHKCPAGKMESIMMCGEDVYMDYFQDYNPAPIGLYMRAC